MKKSSTKKVGNFIIPMLSAGLTISIIQSQDLCEELSNTSSNHPDHPNEEPFYPDNFGIMRDKLAPVATGTFAAYVFSMKIPKKNLFK